MLIYKICSSEAWQEAVVTGRFLGAEIDLRDGFIHFSAVHQVKETAAKHFAGEHDLVLIAVDTDRLGDSLKWEVSRGGDEFPHLYASMDVSTAVSVVDLPLGDNGTHQFPPLDDAQRSA